MSEVLAYAVLDVSLFGLLFIACVTTLVIIGVSIGAGKP